jgi:DNA polymerase sigma
LRNALSEIGVNFFISPFYLFLHPLFSSTKVPIVKLVHASTQVAADVSFNVPDGLATGWFMRDQLVKHPALRPLLLVLKFFLAQRNLNETYPSGGVGSFLLQMMALSFVQHRALNRRAAAAADRAKNANNNRRGSGGGGGGGDQNEQASKLSSPFDGGGNDDADCQLGLLLLGFLELYGRKLNLDEVGISVLGQGSYFRKQHKQWEGGPPRASGLLCMENPLLPKVDVGKNAFNFATVRRAMIHGHMVLTEAIVVQHEAMKATPIDSLTSSGSSSSSSSAAASSSAPSSPKAVSALAAIIFAADPLLTERELPPRPAPPLVHQIDSTTAAEEKHQQSSDQHALSSRGMNALFSATLPPPPQPRYDDEDEEKSSDSLDDDDSATQKKSKPSGRSSSAPPLSKRSKSEASAKKNQQIQQLAEDFGDYASAAKKFKSEKKAAKNKKALAAKKDKKKAISKVDLETVDPEAHQAKMASKAAKRARKKARKNDTAGDSTTTSPAFTITNRSDTRAPDGVVLATK